MNKIINIFKASLKFILKHPIITTTIICLILCFIDGRENRQWNIAGYAFLELFIIALLSPYIRKLRQDKQAKEDADYLAKKIADEIKHPENH